MNRFLFFALVAWGFVAPVLGFITGVLATRYFDLLAAVARH